MSTSSILLTICSSFSRLSVIFLDACTALVVPLMCSFRIFSLLVTPHIRLSILISYTSSCTYCPLVVAHVSAPYNRAGLTTVLYTFPFSFSGILLLHHIPLHLFQFLHAALTLCVISVAMPPVSHTLEPIYVKRCILRSSSPRILLTDVPCHCFARTPSLYPPIYSHLRMYICLKLKFRQYLSIHTN